MPEPDTESFLFCWIVLLIVSSVLMTLVGGIWLHWLAFPLVLIVSVWIVMGSDQ